MRKYLAGFALGLAILGAVAFTCRQIFEIHTVPEWVPPSREARINPYLALDRWLTETEHPVRLADSGDYETLEAAGERTIFIQASLFDWSAEAAGFLLSWAEGGGILVLSLDYNWVLGKEGLAELLAGLGIAAEDSSGDWSYRYHDSEPRLDRGIVFEVPAENSNILVMEDSGGSIRLVQILRGKGKVTVTGSCRFMRNYFLENPPNARLAWNLLAEASGTPGVFFIRDFRERQGETGFFGRLFERGNFFAPLLSALLLMAAGFWSALSVFGVVRGDGERPGKPLRERFLAEGRFLKRFGALDSYRAAYQKEIKKKFLKQEGLENEDEIMLRAAALWKEAGGEDNPEAVKRALSQSPLRYGDFRKTIIILKGILERL